MTAVAATTVAAPVHAAPAGFTRLGRAGLYAALVGALLVAGLIAVGVTTSLHPKPATRCSFGCPPPSGTPVADQRTWSSRAHRFQVDYSSRWTLADESANGARFQTQAGLFLVAGGRTDEALEQLVADRVGGLSSAVQDVRSLGPLSGAHIGDVDGVGELYGATLVPTSGQAVQLRIPVIAARRDGLAVVATAIDPYDASGSSGATGIPEAGLFDYALTEFRWPAGH